MAKSYILINLNKEESAETRIERSRERTRWAVFFVLILIFLGANSRVLMINSRWCAAISTSPVLTRSTAVAARGSTIQA